MATESSAFVMSAVYKPFNDSHCVPAFKYSMKPPKDDSNYLNDFKYLLELKNSDSATT